jgi:ubiquinol-cytochrome c reductase cytochrome b subunit
MLRATNPLMINVFSAIIALATVFALLKGRFGAALKVAIVIVALVAIALLNTFDAKFWGVVVMGGAVIILFFLPWLDHSPARSIRYRPGWHKAVFAVFVFFFLALGYLGSQPPSDAGNYVSQAGTLVYLGFFLLMPWWSRMGEFKPVPERVTFAAH